MPIRSAGFRLAAVSALVLSLTACSLFQDSTVPAADQDDVLKLTVLHTNDHHGRFWTNSQGEWGMVARMTLVSNIREEVAAEGGHVLLLSGGDINTGVPESDLQNAIPDFKGMNMLGYDAMAVGNHEFDNPPEVLAMQQEIANFPFLSANILREENGENAFQPYTMFELGDMKVGVLGLTTLDTPKASNPDNMIGLEFISPIDAAADIIPELREKSDIVIAVTHMGHYPNASHGINSPGDVTLARNVDGIDMIVGGHSQDPLYEPDIQNGTIIVQAQDWGRYVGRADFEFSKGQLTLVDYKLIPVNHADKGMDLAPHLEMLNLLTPYQEKGAKLVEQVVGSVDERLVGNRNEVRFRYTNLGTLMTRAMMEKAGADLAVMNGGGIRASIAGGEISYRDILTVAPFSNALAYVDMTGAEVVDYLNVVAAMPTNSGAFAHFSGVEMLIDGEKVDVIKIGGQSVDPKKTYRMALMNFSANGGDNYPNLTSHHGYVDTGYIDADVLREYVQDNSPIKVENYLPVGVERRG